MGYRYIGSKDKLSDIIISEIRNIKPNTEHVIDLMAGTGLFSLALKEAGFQVSALDVMTYSFHHLTVHLRLDKEPPFENIDKIKGIEAYRDNDLFSSSNYKTIQNYLNNLKPVKGYFYKEFSPDGNPKNTEKKRKYFTSANAAKIDAIRQELKKLRIENVISDIEHSVLLHDLIMAANDVANIAGTYGHYLSKFVKRAESPLQLYLSTFSNKGKLSGHSVHIGYAEEKASSLTADFCYIDPPYIKRQYAANYHVLETIAREDEPEAIGVSGLRPWRDQYSNFCSKVKIRDSFDKILKNVNCSDFLISYSEDGLLSLDELTNFLSTYGEVTPKELEYKRFKSNDSKKGATLTEYLIHLRKN